MTTQPKRHMFVGLPASGKTTFLAALWYAVRSGDVNVALEATVLTKDRDYLNSISDMWAQGEKQNRTPVGEILEVTMHLKSRLTEAQSTLSIPDISGEMLLGHWSERTWSKQFHDIAIQSTSAILFLHPNGLYCPVSIADVNGTTASLGNDDDGDSTQESDPKHEPFDPLLVAQQVVLIDHLQCLLGAPVKHERIKLSLVVSAWDEVPDQSQHPLHFAADSSPMLHQFLVANSDRIELRAFGVSAQGGNLDDETQRTELLLLDSPVERIKVFDGEVTTNDIAVPILWLME
tara:strand:- start:2662 stop:3531 length:870 start_codon:yes stop_codon:yes gene_type:complete